MSKYNLERPTLDRAVCQLLNLNQLVMNEKLSILFLIKRNKQNKKGLCPIFTRLTYQKKRKEFATGLFVKPEEWDAGNHMVFARGVDNQFLISELMLIKQKVNKSLLALQLKDIEFDVNDIYNHAFKKTTKVEIEVISYFRDYLSKMEKLIGKDIKESTWKKFNYVCNDLESFVQYKFHKMDIPFSFLKLSFLVDFEYYLRTTKNQKQITINKAIQRFKKPIKVAVSEGHLDKDPFMLHRSKTVKKEVVFLTNEELKKLEEYEFTQTRLQQVKDMFVFCCYTGLAYTEMANLKPDHIQKGFDKNLWIKMSRQKTEKPISIPLLHQANDILNKHRNDSQLLPIISNQRFNSYLKEIAEITGIQKRLTHHTARKTFASTVLLYNDVPMEIVSELLGHSSITITEQSYGKVVQKKVSEEMQKLMKKWRKN